MYTRNTLEPTIKYVVTVFAIPSFGAFLMFIYLGSLVCHFLYLLTKFSAKIICLLSFLRTVFQIVTMAAKRTIHQRFFTYMCTFQLADSATLSLTLYTDLRRPTICTKAIYGSYFCDQNVSSQRRYLTTSFRCIHDSTSSNERVRREPVNNIDVYLSKPHSSGNGAVRTVTHYPSRQTYVAELFAHNIYCSYSLNVLYGSLAPTSNTSCTNI